MSPTPSTNPISSATTTRLFREEVLDAASPKLMGKILFTPRIGAWWVALFATAVASAVVAFIFWGSYTRRATVAGQIVPTAGVMRIHTPQMGVVLEKKVVEGQLVAKGDVLYVLSSDRVESGAREIQAAISAQVGERKRSMQAELERNKSLESNELALLLRRIETGKLESATIERQKEQQRTRLALASDAYKRYQGLADKDYVAREQLFQKEVELTEAQSRTQALQRDTLSVQRDLDATQREIENTRARYAAQNAQLVRGISSSDQELTEVEAKRRVVITAPLAGRATLVVAEVGQVMDTSRPLVNLVPEGGSLEARLYAPSRTIGFVKPGQQVLLRYQSFPYQKFGQYAAVVETISNNASSSTELTGISLPDAPAGEPVYAITVRLKEQAVRAYGQQIALQPGMRLEADILQETRKLYEWMLEPLYSVTGKME